MREFSANHRKGPNRGDAWDRRHLRARLRPIYQRDRGIELIVHVMRTFVNTPDGISFLRLPIAAPGERRMTICGFNPRIVGARLLPSVAERCLIQRSGRASAVAPRRKRDLCQTDGPTIDMSLADANHIGIRLSWQPLLRDEMGRASPYRALKGPATIDASLRDTPPVAERRPAGSRGY